MYGYWIVIGQLTNMAAKHASVTVCEHQNMNGQRMDKLAHTAAKHALVKTR
jgi:hypothetical protein